MIYSHTVDWQYCAKNPGELFKDLYRVALLNGLFTPDDLPELLWILPDDLYTQYIKIVENEQRRGFLGRAREADMLNPCGIVMIHSTIARLACIELTNKPGVYRSRHVVAINVKFDESENY